MGAPSLLAIWLAARAALAMPPAWGIATCTIALILVAASPRRPDIPSTLPVTGEPDMAYLTRTITLNFDGVSTVDGRFADENGKPMVLPNIGEGMWVTIRNPLLMPQSLLMPKREVAMNPDGTPVDREEALTAGAEVIATLIVDWNLTDVLDLADDTPVLETPTNADVLRNHVPSVVGDTIAAILGRARNPQ